MIIEAGATNITVPVYFVDDVSGTATGEPTTGLLFSNIETGGSASFHRQGAARVDFALVTVAVAAAHTDGGFILVDNTNMPGVYRLDVPDAAFVTGADFVIITLVAASGNDTLMRPIIVDLSPAVDLVTWLGTAPSTLNNNLVQADIQRWLNVVPNALISGQIDSAVGFRINTAVADFAFLMVNSTNHVTGETGLTFGASNFQRSIDGGAFANSTNTAVEIGNGVYAVDLSAADLNGSIIVLKATGTGADDRIIVIKTET